MFNGRYRLVPHTRNESNLEKNLKKSNSPLVFFVVENSRRFRLFIVFDQIRIVFANQDDI